MNIEEVLDKYNESIINRIDKENLLKIVGFLLDNKCDYIDELIEDYLDLFSIDYLEFIYKFNYLNEKYNNNLIDEIRKDMNVLLEFFS